MTARQNTLPLPADPLSSYPPDTDEKPLDRLLRAGAEALSDAELLGLFLPRGSTPVASSLLSRLQELDTLSRAAFDDLADVDPSERVALLGALELARRFARTSPPSGEHFADPADFVEFLTLRYGSNDSPLLGAVYLDARNRLIVHHELHSGAFTPTAVTPAAVFKEGLLKSASSLLLYRVLDGDPSPSSEDLHIARTLAAAADLIGIRLLDYLLLGGGGRWVSLNRRGLC